MYKNIGNKIQILAQVIGIFEMIVSFVSGLIMLLSGMSPLTSIALMIGGPIVAWISSWFLYGYGVLIEKACIIARNTCGDDQTDVYYDEDEI